MIDRQVQSRSSHTIVFATKRGPCDQSVMYGPGKPPRRDTPLSPDHRVYLYTPLNDFSVSATTWQGFPAPSGCLQALEPREACASEAVRVSEAPLPRWLDLSAVTCCRNTELARRRTPSGSQESSCLCETKRWFGIADGVTTGWTPASASISEEVGVWRCTSYAAMSFKEISLWVKSVRAVACK